MKYINLAFVFVFITYLFLLGNRSGALPSNTGAPGEFTCGRSVCHDVPANNGSGSVLIALENDMTTYAAGDTQTISITLEDSPTVRNGFQILALDESEENVGEWILTEPDLMQVIDGFSGLQDRMYITHKEAGTSQSSWSFDWVAPESNQGDITFYVSVMATNNNAENTGDTLYNLSKTIEFDDAVATSELIQYDQFRVFPNPVQDWLQYEGTFEEPIRATVYDASGKQLRVFDLVDQGQQMNMSSLKAGVYSLLFEFENGVLARKILKF